MAESAEVVVVGGGVMGASVAYQLARRGARGVVLLDRGSIASGQTGRSSAVIRMHYAAQPLVRLALHSLGVFQHFGDVVGGQSGFTACGYVAVAGERDRVALEHNVAMQRETGVRTALLEPDEVRRLVPEMAVDDLVGGAYEPASGYADPVLTTQAYAEAASDRGVDVRPNTTALRLVAEGDSIGGVETPVGAIRSRCVVACPGVWAPGLLRPLGVDLPITAIREEMIVFERPPGFAAHPVVHDVEQGIYLRPEREQTLVGNTDRRRIPEIVDPDSALEGASPATVEDITAKLVRRFPVMVDGAYRRGYAGLYDVTPDLCPIVEETPVRGLYVAAGFSGQGFKIAPAIGALVAELVMRGTTDEVGVPASLFSSERFGRGDAIRGDHVYRKDARRTVPAA